MREQWLKDMVRDGEVKVPTVKAQDAPKPHRITRNGKPLPREEIQYGTLHDMDCPGCEGTSFTASPRSETYWAS